MYNFIEYSDNYSDTSGSLWEFERDEPSSGNAELAVDNNGILNSQSFRYTATLVGKTENAANNDGFVKNTKIFVPLKYLSNSWRSLEMPLINCKIHPELNWIKDWILSSNGNSAKLHDAKLHVSLVTLSTKDNVKLRKQLSDGFKRSAYSNSYQAKHI